MKQETTECGRQYNSSGSHPGAGPGGSCVCPKCGAVQAHTRGVPCFTVRCPECGTPMRRDEKQ